MRRILSLVLLAITIGFVTTAGPMYDENTVYNS